MFLFLFTFISQRSWNYDLQKPFNTKNQTDLEYGWSIFGNTATTKQFIRLTSAVTENYGGVCQQKPTLSRDWTVDLEIRARDGNGGDGFWIYFSSDFCIARDYELTEIENEESPENPFLTQHFPTNWDGFLLWINTTNTAGQTSVYLVQSTKGKDIAFDKLVPSGHFNVRGDEPLTIKITRKGAFVQAKFIRGYQSYTFDGTFNGLPDYGYFSVAASTLSYADNNDLLSFRYTANSPETNQVDNNIEFNNRQLIILDKTVRRQKKQRRQTELQTSMKYDEERKHKEHKMDGRKTTLKDAFKMTKETTERAMHTVTKEALEEFIVSDIDVEFAKTIININLQMTRFNETKQDVQEIWMDLKNQLRDLTMETRSNMMIMGRDLMKMAKETTLKSAKDLNMKEVDDMTTSTSPFIPFILIAICIVEFVLYILWFNYKRTKTNNFKKAD